MTATKNFTKRDEINSRSSLTMQDLDDGTMLRIVKAAIIKRPDKDTGEEKDVSIMVLEDGTVFSAISATICDFMPDIIELIDDEGEPLDIRLNKRKSKAGREFLSLTVL